MANVLRDVKVVGKKKMPEKPLNVKILFTR
jgi:hypothetical protein